MYALELESDTLDNLVICIHTNSTNDDPSNQMLSTSYKIDIQSENSHKLQYDLQETSSKSFAYNLN